MAQLIVDWQFSTTGVANGDGTMAATVQGTAPAAGPGESALGPRATALAFASGASCQATLSPGAVDARRFAVRILFRATGPVVTRENLVESTALPFSITVEPGESAQRFNIAMTVTNGAVGAAAARTANRLALEVGRWYLASLVYDLDTLALLVDDTLIAVAAFPSGGLAAGTGDKLFVGCWIDGARWPFTGEIAGLQLWRDIPEELEAKLDAERGSPEWHLSRKENEMRPHLNLGPKTADFYFDTALRAWVQSYALAVIMYTDGDPSAFVMYGLILAKWRSSTDLRVALGSLASDEINGRRAGSRKSVFRSGCLYWSPQSGAFPVLGRMYLDFELLGEGASAIGLPNADEELVSGGRRQRFQTGVMYLRAGASNAFEIHGLILAKYDATGGPGAWGFPVTSESDLRRDSASIGKISEFEHASIYWSPATGAHLVYGAIRNTYGDNGGPQGALGFPTSDEADIPGAAGRYNTFEHGSILWFNGPTYVCWPFNFRLGRLDTQEEDRDIFDLDGQNDLYCRVCVDVNGGRVLDKKIPDGSTHFSSANIMDLNYRVPYAVTPNDPNLRVRLRVEVWESDSGQLFAGGDDNLGNFTKDLTMANAWGLRESADGTFSAVNFGPWVNRLDWSITPVVGPNTPFDFWGVTNRGTTQIEWREYADAFGDVDPDFELDFGIIDDGLKALYYELVVKGVAAGGNCFGMSLEAIYAWNGMSRLGRPLSRYTTWNNVENDFNVKHAYQVGADAIWWMVGQFLAGNTHNPKGVFQATWDAFNRGLNPVLCIAQNYDFSGAPHCIMPCGWDSSTSPWKLSVFDPNRQNTKQTIFIDPAANTFRYDAGNHYEGSEWSGGRLHYMPFSALNHRQRTPVWDAIMLLLGGVIMIFGDSTEVAELTDDKGNSLDSKDVRSREQLSGKLLRIPGVRGDGSLKGAFYVGQQPTPRMMLSPDVRATMAMSTLQPSFQPGVMRLAMGAAAPPMRAPVVSDAAAGSLAGSALMSAFRQGGAMAARVPQATGLGSLRAKLRGRNNGALSVYVKRPLQGVSVNGQVATNENVQVGFDRLGARDNEVTVQSDRARRYDLTFSNKVGAGADFVRVRIEGLPADAGKAVRVSVQPGLPSLDILAGGTPSAARIVVDGKMAGRPIAATFNTQIQGGVRLALPDPASPTVVKQGVIDQLFGNARAFRTITKQ